ncbi:MAG: dipeptidase [Desulfovibrionales bacterium]
MPYPIFDTHVDLLHHLIKHRIEKPFSALDEGILTPKTLSRGGVRIFGSAFYCPDKHNGSDTALAYLQSLLVYAEKQTASLPLVRTREDLRRIWQMPGAETGTIFLLENCDSLVEWGVDACRQAGFSILGLTHISGNRLGDGNGVESPRGLSSHGRRIVREAEEIGLIIDVAHLSRPTFQDAVEVTDSALISTHTGFARFNPIPRNLTDDQIRLLIDRGGMIGVAVAPEILAPNGKITIEDLEVQIDWFVQRFGPAHLGLGTDFGGFRGSITGLENPSQLQELASLLENRGYGEQNVAGIMWENWYSFFSRSLPSE